jgi:hypothetical protein
VAHQIFRFCAEAGKQLGEEVMGRLFVHLLEVGYPLLGHLCCSFRSYWVAHLPIVMLPSG